MTEINDTDGLLESLVDLGIVGTGFMWDRARRERAEQMSVIYGPEVTVMLQYVWQGGYRDMVDFHSDYQARQKYLEEYGQAFDTGYVEAVRMNMLDLAQSDDLPFIFCPFMKARARVWIETHPGDREKTEEVFCYVAEGISRDEFVLDTDKRDAYLRSVGILR